MLNAEVGEGVLHVSAMAASCDDDPANEYPACHVHQQDWGVPVRLTDRRWTGCRWCSPVWTPDA